MPPIVRLAGYNVDAELLSETIDILREVDQLSKSMGNNPSASELRSAIEKIGDDLRSRIDFEAFTPRNDFRRLRAHQPRSVARHRTAPLGQIQRRARSKIK